MDMFLAKTLMSHNIAILRGGTLDSRLKVYCSGPGSARQRDSLWECYAPCRA